MPILLYGSDPASFQRRWMSFAAWGLAAIAFGIAVMVWPGLSLRVIVTLFAAFTLASGILLIVSAIAVNRASLGGWWWISPLPGVALVALAAVALAWPREVSELFVMAFAVIAILWGAADLSLAAGSRRYFTGWWVRALRGALVVLAGVVVVARPVAGLVAASWVIGAWAIVVGVISIAIGLWIKATPVP